MLTITSLDIKMASIKAMYRAIHFIWGVGGADPIQLLGIIGIFSHLQIPLHVLGPGGLFLAMYGMGVTKY